MELVVFPFATQVTIGDLVTLFQKLSKTDIKNKDDQDGYKKNVYGRQWWWPELANVIQPDDEELLVIW